MNKTVPRICEGCWNTIGPGPYVMSLSWFRDLDVPLRRYWHQGCAEEYIETEQEQAR